MKFLILPSIMISMGYAAMGLSYLMNHFIFGV